MRPVRGPRCHPDRMARRIRPSRRLVALLLAGVAAVTLALAPGVSRPDAAVAAGLPYESYQWAHRSSPEQWLDCRPIWYRVNRRDMPKGMDAVVRRTMRSIAAQTGATFHDAGTTTRAYGSKSYSPYNPTIYISFTKRHSLAGTTFSNDGVVGEGGVSAASYTGSDWTFETVTHGDVVLYSGFTAPRTGAGVTWQSLILHEVGHALNLAHRTSPHDVMYPELTASAPGRYSTGEVRALKAVLKRSSCSYDRYRELARAQQH